MNIYGASPICKTPSGHFIDALWVMGHSFSSQGFTTEMKLVQNVNIIRMLMHQVPGEYEMWLERRKKKPPLVAQMVKLMWTSCLGVNSWLTVAFGIEWLKVEIKRLIRVSPETVS